MMFPVINSELFKLRTTRTFIALVGVSLAIALVAAILISAFVNFDSNDVANEILPVVIGPIVRAIALVIGVLAVTNEFRHGTITPTLLVVPNRTKLMLAKLVAVLALALALGFVVGLVMILSSAAFGSFRDFDAGGDELSILLGSTLATALNAALGLGVGVLVRNQVGAIVGALVYMFVLEPLASGLLSLSDSLDGFMPKYSLGAVTSWLAGVSPDEDVLLEQLPAGLLLTLYAAIFVAAGLYMLRRRDVTA